MRKWPVPCRALSIPPAMSRRSTICRPDEHAPAMPSLCSRATGVDDAEARSRTCRTSTPSRVDAVAELKASLRRADGEWYVVHSYAGLREQGEDQSRDPDQVAGHAGVHLPDRGADRRGHRDQERPAQAGPAQGLPGLHPGPDGPDRRILERRPEHPRRDRIRRRHRAAPVPAVARRRRQDPRPGRPEEAAAGHRRSAGPASQRSYRGRLHGRRVGHRHGRPVRHAAGHHQRGQRRRPEAEGAGLDLRPRDARSSCRSPRSPRSDRFRTSSRPPGQDPGASTPHHTPSRNQEEKCPRRRRNSQRSSSCRSRPAWPTRRRRSAPRSASTASTSWSSARPTTQRPSRSAGTSSRSRSPSTKIARSTSSSRPRRPPGCCSRPPASKRDRVPRTPPRSPASRPPRCARSPTLKQVDLNANDIDAAAKIISGTARSMGITIKD